MPNENRKWVFEISSCDRIPPRIGRGQDRDPIYPPMTRRAYLACRKFYEQAANFLIGSSGPPSIECVIKAVVPHGSILKAILEKATDNFGPKLLVKFEDLDRPREKNQRSPRWFDPEYFPAIAMLTYAGGSLRFDDKRKKKDNDGNLIDPHRRRLIVSFGRGANANISLLRIIMDASAGYQSHRTNARLNKDYHYEYRRSALEFKSDDAESVSGHRSGKSRRGRKHAIRVAGDHLATAIARKEQLADPSLNRDQYEYLLRDIFRIADELHKMAEGHRQRD